MRVPCLQGQPFMDMHRLVGIECGQARRPPIRSFSVGWKSMQTAIDSLRTCLPAALSLRLHLGWLLLLLVLLLVLRCC